MSRCTVVGLYFYTCLSFVRFNCHRTGEKLHERCLVHTSRFVLGKDPVSRNLPEIPEDLKRFYCSEVAFLKLWRIHGDSPMKTNERCSTIVHVYSENSLWIVKRNQWWSVTKYNYFVTVLKYIFQVSVLYWSSFILSNFYFYFTTFQSIRSYFLLHYIS